MESKTKNIALFSSLIFIGLGIWAIVLQNAGIIPTNHNVQVVNTVDTYVQGGNVDADVEGSVEIYNTVDVNIDEINGWEPTIYDKGLLGVYDPYKY